MRSSATSSPDLTGARVAKTVPVSRATLLRALLVAGGLAAVAAAASLGSPEARAGDPDLVRMLLGMALIKAALVLAAAGLLLWRFGHPVTMPLAVAYLAGTWVAAGASMLVWQLTSIPLAALAFHVGEIALLVAAWKDGSARA